MSARASFHSIRFAEQPKSAAAEFGNACVFIKIIPRVREIAPLAAGVCVGVCVIDITNMNTFTRHAS